MHTVILEGQDLQYFGQCVQGGIAGDYGPTSAAQVYVLDDGTLQLGINGHLSQPFGRPNAPLVHPNETDGVTTFSDPVAEAEAVAALANTPSDEGDSRNFPPEGSGNPYRNVPDDDPANVLARLDRLERFANRVAREYGLDLPALQV